MARNGEIRLGVSGLLSACMSLALGVAVVLTVVAFLSRSRRESDYELARLGLEDVSRRVERESRNLRSVREMSDGVALSRARALARLVAENPTILSAARRSEFDAYARMLEVDELHVSDEKGVLVRSFPALYEGRSLADSAQSAAFMPAITNRAFELVQEPQGKGISVGDKQIDGMVFQYAGVSRIDSPGIIQVGYRAERVEEALRLSDVGAIAATARVGRHGKVSIVKNDGLGEIVGSGHRHVVDPKLGPVAVFESDTSGYRITVTVPESGSFLAEEDMFSVLVVLDLILLLLFLVSMPSLRTLLVNDFRILRRQLSVKVERSVSFFHLVFSPLAIAAFVAFVAVIAVIAVVSVRNARHDAEERLRMAAADIVAELDDCVDFQLSFIGRELTLKYGSPEAMKTLDLMAMMRTYFVDEINVVDGRGLCLNSTVTAIVGMDQRSLSNPARFCEALIDRGEEVFSQPFRNSATEPWVYRKYVGVAFPKPAKGYIQIGFERSRLLNSIDYCLRDIAHAWHIGETGFYVVSKTSNGEILSARNESYEGGTLAGVGFDVFTARMRQNVDERDPESRDFLGFREVNFFESEFDGVECLCTSGVVNQFHRYVAAMPLEEVYGEVYSTVALTAAILFVVMVAVVFFMSRLSALVASLKGYIARENTNRERDFAIARTIQMTSLPVAVPDEERFKVFARMDTAKEVGGDFYDFYRVPSGKLFFLIADVSGKGVPAAMFMMKAKAIIKACALEVGDFASFIAEANARLAENNDAQMFVTCWFGLLDDESGEFEFVNAGHNPPLVRRADGTVEWLKDRGGVALAAMAGMKYRVHRNRLAPGDSLFLYTDGVTEAMNRNGELYSEQRLERCLARSGENFVTEIRADVAAFAAGAEQSDDITMLALDFKQNEPRRSTT